MIILSCVFEVPTYVQNLVSTRLKKEIKQTLKDI